MFLYRMGDLPLTRYPFRAWSNPYLKEEPTTIPEAEAPIPDWTWNGGSRFSQWRDARLFVLERDGYRCQNPTCGTRYDLDVHHKRWRKDGGDDDPSNLTTLCGRCHGLEQQKLLAVNW